MKKTVLVLLTISLLTACGNNINYDDDISSLNSRIEQLESRVSELEAQKLEPVEETKPNKKEKEDIEIETIQFNKGDTISLENKDKSADLTLKDVHRNLSIDEYVEILYPTIKDRSEFERQQTYNYINEELEDAGEIIVFDFTITNTGTIGIDEDIFTKHKIKQNTANHISNQYVNIRMNDKYDYGVEFLQSWKEPDSSLQGISVEILKTENLKMIAIIPEQVKGMPYELSFISGNKEYIYKGEWINRSY